MLEQLAVSSDEGEAEERPLSRQPYERQPSVSIHRLCMNCPEVKELYERNQDKDEEI